MSTALRLIPLQPEDEGALAQLLVANDKPVVTRFFDPFPLTASTARTLCQHKGRDLFWGVWDDALLVGLAMVRGWDGAYEHRVYGLMVDSMHLGRGIGRASTRLMLEEMQRRREPTVRARVHEPNEASVRMLKANGFRELQRTDGRILLECQVESALSGGSSS